MSYLALYRVWRPQRFDQVVGQEQTITALKNAVRLKQLSHAYIFSGPRGTGKTSVAKILARVANCDLPTEGEPCNQCPACQDILQGNFMDVIEIDAASNRGIDEIRDLREQVRILPAQGKRKVYIIDEVHMLTTEAFNALLKTLEEPPESVIFILATTELQKIPATIISRCQKYGFSRLTPEQIGLRLQEVVAKDGIEAEPEALQLIARRANGGLRDALGMLDQVLAYQADAVTRAHVMQVLGLADETLIADLIAKSLEGNQGGILQLIGQAFVQGVDARQIIRDASLYLRDLMMQSLLPGQAGIQLIGASELEELKERADRVPTEVLREAIALMMATGERMRYAEEQRFMLEMAFLELCNLLSLKPLPAAETPTAVAPAASGRKKSEKTESRSVVRPEQETFWNQILSQVKEIKIPTHALLSQGKFIGIADDTLYIGYKKGYKFHKEKMEEKENRELLRQVLNQLHGRELEVEFLFLDDPRYNDLIVKKAIELFGSDRVEIIKEE